MYSDSTEDSKLFFLCNVRLSHQLKEVENFTVNLPLKISFIFNKYFATSGTVRASPWACPARARPNHVKEEPKKKHEKTAVCLWAENALTKFIAPQRSKFDFCHKSLGSSQFSALYLVSNYFFEIGEVVHLGRCFRFCVLSFSCGFGCSTSKHLFWTLYIKRMGEIIAFAIGYHLHFCPSSVQRCAQPHL